MSSPAKDPKADSFAEKLAMQVVKNLQVKVCDIHVRYEDRTTNPKAPFAIGATLQNISLQVSVGVGLNTFLNHIPLYIPYPHSTFLFFVSTTSPSLRLCQAKKKKKEDEEEEESNAKEGRYQNNPYQGIPIRGF